MSEHVVERFRLTKKSSDYITEYAKKHNLPQRNRVINNIIEEHASIPDQKKKRDDLIQAISQNIAKEINKEISRIRLGTNNTDRNTQILIELLNGFMFDSNVKDIITTDDTETDALNTAKKTVQERIENMKQKKDDKEERRQQKHEQ